MVKLEGTEEIKYIEVKENILVLSLKLKLSYIYDIIYSEIELLLDGQPLTNEKALEEKDISDKVIIIRNKNSNKIISNESSNSKIKNPILALNNENDINYDNFTYKSIYKMLELFKDNKYTTEQQIKIRAKVLLDMYQKSTEEFYNVFGDNTKIVNAVLKGDKVLLEKIIKEKIEITDIKNKQLNNLMKYGPESEEEKKILEKFQKEKKIRENMRFAQEKIPESLIPIHMAFIFVEINNKKIMTLISTGNEMSIIGEKLSKECGLFNLCDTGYGGYTNNGQTKLIGKVHEVKIIIENKTILAPINIIENDNIGFSLGLDILREYNCSLDMDKEELVFQNIGIRTKLLSVNEIKSNKGNLFSFYS